MRDLKILAVLLVSAAGAARADTVEATSTTFLYVGEQTRGGAPNANPDLDTVAPLFESLTVSARNIRNPIAENLQIVLSAWGSYELADPRWDNGTHSDLTGDVLTGYVSAQFLKRNLTVILGRQNVALGTRGYLQLDGGEVIGRLPFGFAISAYAGSPVSQRFASRRGTVSWNPAGGDLAYGGRLSWTLAIPGVAGRGLELGADYAMVTDHGDTAHQQVGGDFRIQPIGNLTLAGFGMFELGDENVALAEANVQGFWTFLPRWHLNASWRYARPDLVLSRLSILSVFADAERNDIGAGVSYDLTRTFSLGVEGRVLLEPDYAPVTPVEEKGSYTGYEAILRADYKRGPTSLGGEAFVLDSLENGYYGARVYGRRDLGRFFLAGDVLFHYYREPVNDFDYAVMGSLSGGWEIGKGWSAVLAGRAGVNPFYEQEYDGLVKLVYNQTYTTREVR
jgi:hypothetical protein